MHLYRIFFEEIQTVRFIETGLLIEKHLYMGLYHTFNRDLFFEAQTNRSFNRMSMLNRNLRVIGIDFEIKLNNLPTSVI